MEPIAASVIIPAHNEERGIGSCLSALAAAKDGVSLEVVVAANGCSDGTVAEARKFPGVQVLDIAEASKVGALNAADRVASAFPRIYLDADVQLDGTALHSLIDILSTDEPRLAAPNVTYDTVGCDPVVRAFYGAFRSLPSVTNGLSGRGVYGLSEAGRQRFQEFPNVQGDDHFVNRLFAPSESVLAEGHSLVRPPRTWRDLVKVRTRIASGNRELARADEAQVGELAGDPRFASSARSTLTAAGRLAVTQPSRAPQVFVFLAVTVAARFRARRSGSGVWHRDSSTR